MANQLQLSLLKEGPETWNEWRREHQPDEVDLRDADLKGAELGGADLSNANMGWAELIRANVTDANLQGADLSYASLMGMYVLAGIMLRRKILPATRLEEEKWYIVNNVGVNLQEAILSGADLRDANLQGAKFGRANLHDADVERANLSWADLSGANLSGASLFEANLSGAILDGANFERSIIGHTVFGTVDISSCRGLDAVRHEGPSTLGIDSIIRSKGRIPEIFLRGVGLPDEWITHIPSLAGDGIQFFSCFISYSSADKPFALRLFDALQSKGIRCWLDEKQLLPGHDISRELERGIHLWDKFLLCASKNSLTSYWVENEIKTTLRKELALRKERGTSVQKLIPLNLDGYMFSDEWDLGVLANEIRSRVAADFPDWEKPDSDFDKQVDRVIRALRADDGAREKPPPSRL